jgi:hypothetical protein
MYSHRLPGTTYHSDDGGDWSHPGVARYVDGDWNSDGVLYPGGVQHLGGAGYQDDRSYQNVGQYLHDGRHANDNPYRDDAQRQDGSRYINHHWRPPHKVRHTPHEHLRQTPHPVHKSNRRKEPAVPIHDEHSTSDGDSEPGKVKESIQKKKAAAPKAFTEEELDALVEERSEKKRTEEKRREIEEREREETRLKEKKELEELHKAEKEQALADQRATLQKEAEEKEDEKKAELERQAQAKAAEKELIRKIEATTREADRKASEDRMRLHQVKAEADKMEEARRAAQAKQDAENLLAENIRREAEKRKAAEMERENKQKAEDMRTFIKDTKKTVSELEKNAASNKVASMKAVSMKAPKEKSTRSKIVSPEETASLKKSEERLARMKELLPKLSKEYGLGPEATVLEEEAYLGGDNETESLQIEVSGSLRVCKETVVQKKQVQAPKEGKRNGKCARNAKGEESDGGYREGRSKKKSTSERRNPGLSAIEWFAGKSYLCR